MKYIETELINFTVLLVCFKPCLRRVHFIECSFILLFSAVMKFDILVDGGSLYLLFFITYVRHKDMKSLNIFILKMENVVFWTTFYEIYFYD
jgi:hypothetical protein